MPIVADAAAAIRADMSPFNRDVAAGFNKADTQAKGLGKSLASALNPKTLLLGLGGGLLGSQVINFLADATNAAAEFEDSVQATGVIFGEEFIPQMEEWGESAAQNFGASKQEALSAANVFATLGKSAGLMGEDLVNFSQEMVQLGGDLASMFGGTTQDAITAVGAALRGESEPIRRYGVLLDDATLRQKAFEMGLISTTKNALTPQQRVLAAQASILEQTSDAQGDFGRTSEGMANTQRELAAEFANLRIEIGEKMLPVMVEIAHFVRDTLLPTMSDLLDLTDGNSDTWEGFARILDQVTGQQGKVQDVMRLTNSSYMDAREIIKDWNAETGKSADVLVELIEKYGSLDAALRAVMSREELSARAAAAAAMMEIETGEAVDGTVNVLEEGGPAIDAASEEAMAGIIEAAEEAREQAVQQISDMFGELIGLFSKDDFEQAVADFHEMLNDPWPDTRRKAAIEAQLASKEVADGLRSDDSRVVAETIEYVNGLVEEYEAMEPGALAAGELVNPALQDGLKTNLQATIDTAEDIASRTGAGLDFDEFAEDAGFSGLSSLNRGMLTKRSAVATTAQGLAGVAKSNLYFDASSGGASSAATFIAGLNSVIANDANWRNVRDSLHEKKLAYFGGSLPKEGPFAASELRSGPRSIAQFWLDELGNDLTRGLTGLRFTPEPMTALPALPATGVGQTLAPPSTAGAVNFYGDVNLAVEDESALDELRGLAEFGSRG